MPGAKRPIDPGLSHRLRQEPNRFEFFQAVRLLLAWHRGHCAKNDRDTLGQVIRFRNSASLAFPPSEIESLAFEWEDEPEGSPGDHGERGGATPHFREATMTPAFIGLIGPLGALPRHYTQHVADRETYHRDFATRGFLDIFTTRAVALFYQSWLGRRLHLQYEADRENRFLPMVLSLAGLALPGTRRRLLEDSQGIPDEALAYYAGALRERPQSVQSFARVASEYFEVRCEAEQFVGQWLDLPEQALSRLGSVNCDLGQSALCGRRIWDRQSRVRLNIGPLRESRFLEFLPGGAALRDFGRLFHLMTGCLFDCEVRLILDKRDLAGARLGGQSAATMLGWRGWLAPRDRATDSRDATFLLGMDSRA
jgi:type VI secretion system protein ImpH